VSAKTLATALGKRLDGLFHSNKTIVVWYDDGGTLGPLVEDVVPGDADLLTFDESYLDLRAGIEASKDLEKRRVLYIPRAPEEPSWLRDYELMGARLDLDLLALLDQEFGLEEAEDVRPLLIPENARRLLSRWDDVIGHPDEPLKTELLQRVLLASVFEQPREFDVKRAVLAYLAYEDILGKALERSRLTESFLKVLAGYGIPKPESPAVDSGLLAAVILLSELAVNSGGVGLEEFSEILPRSETHRKFWAGVAREWAVNEEFQASFIQWSSDVQERYSVLAKVRGKPNLENVTSFQVIDKVLLEEVEARIGEATKDRVIRNREYLKRVARARLQTVWSRRGLAKEWGPILLGTALLERLSAAKESLEAGELSLAALVRLYTEDEGYWRIDAGYQALSPQAGSLAGALHSAFVKLPRRQYQLWLDAVNSRVARLAAQDGLESLSEYMHPERFWESVVRPSAGPVCVFFLDAAAYPLLRKLTMALGASGYEANLELMIAVLPSITEVGMAALLPYKALKLSVQNDEIHVELNGTTVRTREERKEYLRDRLGDKVRFIDLKALLSHSKGKELTTDDAHVLVVFDQSIDKAGSFLVEDLMDTLDRLLERVRQGVRIVSDWGYERIVLTTDHGFLHIPAPNEVRVLEGPKAAPGLVKGRRFAVGKPPKTPGTVAFTPKSLGFEGEEVQVVVPHGISYLPKRGPKESFIHGGLSLQEWVIGYVECMRKSEEAAERVGVRIKVPPTITSAIFTLQLRPMMGKLTARPRRVAVDIIAEGKTIHSMAPREVLNEVEETTIRLKRIPKQIRIRAVDADTREILDQRSVDVALEGYDELL
jgi:hypothetical protein